MTPKLIHENNRQYVEGISRKISNRTEVLITLDRRLPRQDTHSAKIGCTGYFMIFWTLVFGGGGLAVIGIGLLNIWLGVVVSFDGSFDFGTSPLETFLLLLVNAIFFILIGIFIILLGYVIGSSFYLMDIRFPHIQDDFLLLQYRHKCTNGEIVAIQILEKERELTYKFMLPKTGSIDGTFLTKSKVDISPGDKIIVLYLDSNIHVPL